MNTPVTLFEAPDVLIRSVSVSEMDNRSYAVTSLPDGAQALIDAADEPAALHTLLEVPDSPVDPSLTAIITTHAHWDHTRALAEIAQRSGAETIAGAEDAQAIRDERGVTIQRTVGQGDRIRVGELVFDVISLRGHTPGSIALALTPAEGPTRLFTGDSLFPGGVGKTNNPEDFHSLLTDVRERIFDVYDDATVVYPGHGEPTTLGAERPHLDEWEERGW